jgi:hypothetical protein
MSRSSEALVAGLLLAACVASAHAQTDRSAASGAEPPAAARSAEPPPSKARLDDAAPRARGRSVFKCWQYGKLIYEGPAPVGADKSQNALRIQVGNSVQLYDLKSATCILDQAGG